MEGWIQNPLNQLYSIALKTLSQTLLDLEIMQIYVF